MTTQPAEMIGTEDPEGSIFLLRNQTKTPASNLPEVVSTPNDQDGFLFLPNDLLIKKYLSFHHPPENVLGMLFLQASSNELPALLEELDRKLLLTRGGFKPVDPEIDPAEDSLVFDAEVGKRLRYGEVLVNFRKTHALIMLRTIGQVAVTN